MLKELVPPPIQIETEKELPFQVFVVQLDAKLRSQLQAESSAIHLEDDPNDYANYSVPGPVLGFKRGSGTAGDYSDSIEKVRRVVAEKLVSPQVLEIYSFVSTGGKIENSQEFDTFFWIGVKPGTPIENRPSPQMFTQVCQQALTEI